MPKRDQPIQCANCLYPLDEPTVVVNGAVYCCSGCARGGPCICSYGHLSISRRQTPGDSGVPSDPLFGFNPLESPVSKEGAGEGESGLFTRMVENMIKEVEITRQVVRDEPGPVHDLIRLLQKSTRLLQAMAYRLEGPRHHGGPGPYSRSVESYPLARRDDNWEKIALVVENATEPDIAFSYTRALAKLDSVRDIKLVSINQNNLLYSVETRSKAKFARQVMSLPDYRPVRIQATLDELTVLLNGHQKDVSGLEKVLADTPLESALVKGSEEVDQDRDSADFAIETRPVPRSGGRGVMEAGIEGFFNARHYLTRDGEPGPVENRSWRVEISLDGNHFDENGMLTGFDKAQEAVAGLMVGYNNKLLNKLEPYDVIQPTPENIARTLYDQLKTAIADQPLRVKGLKVWASPTQYVWYSEPPGHEV